MEFEENTEKEEVNVLIIDDYHCATSCPFFSLVDPMRVEHIYGPYYYCLLFKESLSEESVNYFKRCYKCRENYR